MHEIQEFRGLNGVANWLIEYLKNDRSQAKEQYERYLSHHRKHMAICNQKIHAMQLEQASHQISKAHFRRG